MIKIEELSEKHLNQYVEFKNDSHKESKYINPTTIEKSKDLINEYKTDKDKIGFIILDNNKIIGQLFLKINRKDNLCHILLISVLKSYYGKNISDKLIDKAISFTKENKLSTLELIVAKDNERAISFYKKKSFKYIKDFSKTNYLFRLELEKASLESITSYIDIPKEVLDIAKTDPIIGTYVTVDKPRIGIYHNDRVVGFYTPFQEEYKGITYWRTGNIYVLPEYRNKGLGTEALIEFFADKPYGMATVVFDNKASLKAFEKAGFRIDYNFYKLNPKGVQLHLLLKKPQEDLKPAFLSWK